MQRRTILKRIGTASVLALTGVQAATASPTADSDLMIRFSDDRKDMRLEDYDADSEDFSLEDDCCFTGYCPCKCHCCIC